MRFATDESKSQLEEAWELLLNHDDVHTRRQARRAIRQVLDGMERLEQVAEHPAPAIVPLADDEKRKIYPERYAVEGI